MLMVGHCLANRYRGGWGDWLGVIERIPLYSARNLDEQPKGQPLLNDPNFLRLLQEIDGIYDGSREDPTLGSLFFADVGTMTRGWFQQEILAKPEEHPRRANCGLLQCWG
jgi:hypothetical protein